MHVQLYTPPRSAGGLPVTRNMPYTQTSMPSQSQPRNMTGIYLGLEGNIKPPRPKTGVPPLARTRGSSRMKTPTEEQRYRRVELLRIKEEKRGFSGNPVKRHQQPNSAHNDSNSSHSPGSGNQGSFSPALTFPGYPSDGGALSDPFTHSRRWGPGKRIDPANLDDLLRPNPRNYTTVANSGVTRSEKLTGWLGSLNATGDGGEGQGGGGDLAKEVGRVTSNDLAGLEECFRKVCKGNVEVLYSLLPGRKSQPSRRENTGFTVRSYRNPNRAEILADFTGGNRTTERPKTVPIRRPLVPQPYFYRHYSNHPGAASISAVAAAQRRFPSLPGVDDGASGSYFSSTSRIVASPGAGSISRTLTHRLQSATTPTTTTTTRLPVATTTAPIISAVTDAPQHRHTTSPTEELDDDKAKQAKGFPSGESTSRTAQDTEDAAAVTDTEQGARGGGGATAAAAASGGEGSNLPTTTEVHVAVAVPSARPLDLTTDSNTTLDDSVTPRHLPDTARQTITTTSETPTPRLQREGKEEDGESRGSVSAMDNEGSGDAPVAEVKVFEEDDNTPSTTEDQKPRPKLTASNSGADIMLGLETDEGQSAEVEIDTADQEELLPEAEAPKGRVRKASITEKVIKTKASEAIAAMIKEEAESRQREFEKLLDEHAELVQEISRTPSSENLIQGERDH